MSRLFLVLVFFVFLFPSHIALATDGNTLPVGYDIPWSDHEVTEFPRQYLGWWNQHSNNSIQGMQFLPNDLIVFMDQNPDNRSKINYRVMRIVGNNVYLAGEFHNFYSYGPAYEYIWLQIYPASEIDPIFKGIRIAFNVSGSLSPESFKKQNSQQLWEDFISKGTRGWTRYFTLGRD